jgi:hypothetical protein
VSFEDPSGNVRITIDNLALQPVGSSADEWLEAVAKDSDLNHVVSKGKTTLAGAKALIVVSRALDRSESENIYQVRERRTVAIRFDHSEPQGSQVRRAVATFQWLDPPSNEPKHRL